MLGILQRERISGQAGSFISRFVDWTGDRAERDNDEGNETAEAMPEKRSTSWTLKGYGERDGSLLINVNYLVPKRG